MALTKIPRGLLDTGIADSSDATAITIDSSENVILSSNLTMPGGSNITWGNHYPAIGNIPSSQATLLGNNIKAGATNNTIIRHANGTDAGTFIGLTYNKGVTFHTGIATTQNSEVAETTNERMRIDATGKVQIGTSTANGHVSIDPADGIADEAYALFVRNNEATDGRNYGLVVRAGSTSADESFSVRDHANASTYFKVRGDGKIGIGTAVGTSQLNIYTGNVTGAGTLASSAINVAHTTHTNGMSQFTFGYQPGSLTYAAAYIGYIGVSQAGNGNGDLVFGTRTATTDSQPSERMRIKADGTVLFTQGSYAAEIHAHSWATTLETTTADGSDNYAVGLDAGGGAGSNARGAGIWCYGNEDGNHPGSIVTQLGAAGVWKLYAGASAAEALRVDASGHLLPGADDTYNLGSSSKRWNNLYVGDMHFSNEGSEGNEVDGTTGNWTLQEGEEHLYIINNKSGKKFKFSLEEIE